MNMIKQLNNVINLLRRGGIVKAQLGTKLTPEEESEFQKWYRYYSSATWNDPNPDAKEHYYDYRGYWKEFVKDNPYQILTKDTHLYDKYKLPGHESFSNESIYATSDAGHWEGDKFIPARTIDDLAKFTAGFETFQESPYQLKKEGSNELQTLAGYGSSNKEIIELAQQGKLTQEMAYNELKRHLQSEYNEWDSRVPNFKNLSRDVQLALVDTSYNGRGVYGTITHSPKLMAMINSGITDPKQLVKEMDHSKSAGGWLGTRSSARRAMALGKYDWDWEFLDKFGRQVDTNQYVGPNDYKSSPYYNKYKSGGKIHIKEENKGKFNALKRRTGKSTEELTHSKNPLTRKRAIFAQNASKWNHKK